MEGILVKYADTFEGLRHIGPPVHVKVEESVQPVGMPNHRIPLAKRANEKEALDRYVKEGVLVKEGEPTPWSSNDP